MDTPLEPITFIADVRAGSAIEPGRLGHTSVLSAPGVRVIVLAFEAGHILKEHTSPKTLLMQALDGHLRVTAAGLVTELAPGALLRLEPSIPHEVEALEDSRLMLTQVG